MQTLRCNGARYYDNFNIIIPGSSGIPEWVTRKSMGREVSIELSENWYEDDNFLGFALFFHLLPLDADDDNNNDDDDYELSTSHGDEDSSRYVEFPPVYHKVGTSDPTLGVLYVPKTAISTKYRSREWNHCKVRCNPTYRCGDKTFKVKSCGVHLLYAQAQAPDKKRHDHPTEDDPHCKISRHV